ncbi:unnamed protein product [Caenorhabditis auriculariae]|uniref:BPL/LPL catalytic domain-containing protein n=1 Tax=Caenorhabditis auriculariae TaxID=2777116 RepID=A0A8S1HCH9_9PELO|nr:unnamed protein product [Caenorhabditis auriculariae]
MILFVWSLVSSAIEVARKRQLASFLRACLTQQQITREFEMLVWKRLRNVAETSFGQLTKYRSEPHLDSCLVFQSHLLQVFSRKFEPLLPAEWIFSPTIRPSDPEAVYFVVGGEVCPQESAETEDPVSYFKLNERCERLAVHKTRYESFYVCPMEMFVDVADAFSEGLLKSDHFIINRLYSERFLAPREIQTQNGLTSKASNSLLSLSYNSQKPMPILQQLFWGDAAASSSLRDRYLSESALNVAHKGHFSSARSSRRRNNSYNARAVTPDLSSLRSAVSPANFDRFDTTFHSLPRYIRHLDERLNSPRSLPPKQIAFGEPSMSSGSARSDVTTSCSTSDTTTISTSVTTETLDQSESHLDHLGSKMEDMRLIDDTDTETVDSDRFCKAQKLSEEHFSIAKIAKREEKPIEQEKTEELSRRQPFEVKLNGCKVIEEGKQKAPETTIAPNFFKPPIAAFAANGVVRGRRSASVVASKFVSQSQRRFSTLSGDGDRHRSLSPSFEYFQLRSIRFLSSQPQDSTRDNSVRSRPYTPTFLASRDKSHRPMPKPPSILVYTAGEQKLYDEIRGKLSHLLPPDEITVFNLSVEAMRRQPWIEPATMCVIVASTKELDDVSWGKMQSYFNQKGKIIFVCQNKLLSSLTHCDSSKQQADMLRLAFGGKTKLEETNKEFAKFLKKCLKHLAKSNNINETFRSKEISADARFTVVFKKEKETPLLLYMHNSESHLASAVFSDATTEQLMAPNSNLLRDSLQSVGVKVQDIECVPLTKGFLLAEFDSILEEITGIRYGEKIGGWPKVFLRKAEIAEEEGLPTPSTSLLPIEIHSRKKPPQGCSFNFDAFFDKLKCKLGKVVLHVPVATTTMDVCSSICDAIPSLENVLVVADHQTKGRGRGGNEFLSPTGVAMFTFAFRIPRRSRLGSSLSIIQHVFCVALVEAAHRLSGEEHFPLRIKWPNDFYFNRSHKVGGMLAAVNTRDDGFLISIGAGINVWNEKPTVCLNDMLPKDSENKINVEELIAESLNRFQYWMTDFENNGGERFRRKYYEYWLHNYEEVYLQDIGEKVMIRGLDENGFLEVRSKENSGKVFSITDDGNTFDMMKGLIRQKIV